MTASGGAFVVSPLKWLTAFEIGRPEIDEDHRRLFSDSNLILRALDYERPWQEVLSVVKKMQVDCIEHFRREERILAREGFPGADEHEREHRRLERELVDLVVHMENTAERSAVSDEAALYFRSMLINHVVRYDLRFKSYLMSRQGL